MHVCGFGGQVRASRPGRFRRIVSILAIPTSTGEKWLESVARRPKPSDTSGTYWLCDSRDGERHDRRCRFAFKLTSCEREWARGARNVANLVFRDLSPRPRAYRYFSVALKLTLRLTGSLSFAAASVDFAVPASVLPDGPSSLSAKMPEGPVGNRPS